MTTGGEADKFGNSYEGLWTVNCLLDLIDEEAYTNINIKSISPKLYQPANAMHLEPSGEEGKGVEFWLQKGDIREYHQVKTKTTQYEWTIKNLNSGRIHVLSDFQDKLSNPSSHCKFISNKDASQLRQLSNIARDSQSWSQPWSDFVKDYLITKDDKLTGFYDSFLTLVNYWNNQYTKDEIQRAIDDFKGTKLSNQQQSIIKVAEDTYEKLKRVYIRSRDKESLSENVENRLRRLIEPKHNNFPSRADYKTAIEILAGLALESIRQILRYNDIWEHLDTRGYQRCNDSKNPHVLAAIDKANQLYLSPLEKQTVIAGQSIPRQETEEAFNLLLNTQDKKGVFLIGEAGVGKSGVMLQIAKKLEQEKIKFFVFRIDNLPPEVNPDYIGRKYGLPHSPAIVLANISKYSNSKQETILIIDQLDAVSQVSGRNPQFFDCIYSLIEQTLQFSKVRVLVACRKFDLDNDSRIKNLIGKEGILETVEIKRLLRRTS